MLADSASAASSDGTPQQNGSCTHCPNDASDTRAMRTDGGDTFWLLARVARVAFAFVAFSLAYVAAATAAAAAAFIALRTSP